jgi:cytochrome c peroxidase
MSGRGYQGCDALTPALCFSLRARDLDLGLRVPHLCESGGRFRPDLLILIRVTMRPKTLAQILLLASVGVAVSIAARAQTPASTAIPASPAPRLNPGGRLADPEPASQAGFPHDLYRWVLPDDNLERPPAKIALGRALFFDRRLSADDKESCSTCHDPEKGFTDQLPTSMGIHNQFGKRNAPTIVNATFNILQFWDGREPTLEEQARRPILNPIEMGMPDEKSVVDKLTAAPEYQKAFVEVFGHPPNYDDMVKAIASFERTQVAFD